MSKKKENLMTGPQISERVLDAAIKSMERSRTLLFTVNLIAALVLMIAYLEHFGFNDAQKENYLLAFDDRCNMLVKLVRQGELDSAECKNPSEESIQKLEHKLLTSKKFDQKTFEDISFHLYKLHLIYNEISDVKFNTGTVAPLGIGVPISRNDMLVIFCFLLMTFYVWLLFSFRQLASIVTYISDHSPQGVEKINKLIDLNFLFRTKDNKEDKKLLGIVFLIIYSAPITVAISTFSSCILLSQLPEGAFNKSISSQKCFFIIFQFISFILLSVIAYFIHQADKEIDKKIDNKIDSENTSNNQNVS